MIWQIALGIVLGGLLLYLLPIILLVGFVAIVTFVTYVLPGILFGFFLNYYGTSESQSILFGFLFGIILNIIIYLNHDPIIPKEKKKA